VSDTRVLATKRIVPALVPVTEALSPYAEPMVRVATGLLLVPHGAQKLFGWFGGHGIDGTGQFFASKGGFQHGSL
jgi:putative oxidoreductase